MEIGTTKKFIVHNNFFTTVNSLSQNISSSIIKSIVIFYGQNWHKEDFIYIEKVFLSLGKIFFLPHSLIWAIRL